MVSARRIFFTLVALQFFWLGIPHPSARGDTAKACADIFSDTTAAQIANEVLLSVQSSESASIRQLGKLLIEVAKLSREGMIYAEARDAFDLELAQIFSDVRQLIKLSEEGAREADIAEFSQEFITQLSARIAYFTRTSGKSAESGVQQLSGAKFLPVGEVDSPKLKIFIADHAGDYDRWLSTLSQEYRDAIHKRLRMASAEGHFGDAKVLHHALGGAHTHLFEMRFHLGVGVRIYFCQVGSNVVIFGFGTKGSQDRDIRHAVLAADFFFL